MTSGPLLDSALWITDRIFAAIPRRKPSQEAISKCKIVSHRGEHDNKTIRENTMEAFRVASNAGVWGLEMDIRWTRDLVPVVIHDPDTMRVFGKDVSLRDTTFADLRGEVPEIPTFEEFIAEFGGENHLMIEIKEETFPDLEKQKRILKKLLSGLRPKEDYHLLALDLELFDKFDIVPNEACLPVATLNFKQLSALALERRYAGISGHFLVLDRSMKRRHEAIGQMFGTGFPTSRYALYRELNRGVEYIFTNDALKLLDILKNKNRQ